MGGAVLPLLGIGSRVTADVDVVGPETTTQADTVTLLRIAVELGLPPETIDQSAAFFLRSIDGWEDETEILLTGKSATIRIPTATLFVLSKLERLSETDLADCVAVLDHAERTARTVDHGRLRRALAAASEAASHSGRLGRVRRLRRRISAGR